MLLACWRGRRAGGPASWRAGELAGRRAGGPAGLQSGLPPATSRAPANDEQ